MTAIKFLLGFIVVSSFMTTGCLRTRGEIKRAVNSTDESGGIQQQEKAALMIQIEELQGQLREMTGRIENIELDKEQEKQQAQSKENEVDKFKLFEEALVALEQQVRGFKKDLAEVKLSVDKNRQDIAKGLVAVKAAKEKAAAKKVPKGNYSSAQYFFDNKDWRKAITGYQKYREMNPKGRRYLEATYKIGVCFQELGMKTEAKVFFDEVVEKNPKSKEAKKSRIRLQALAK